MENVRPAMRENVLSALFKSCPVAEENYLTEAYVFVQKLLLERMPDEGGIILQLSECPCADDCRCYAAAPSRASPRGQLERRDC